MGAVTLICPVDDVRPTVAFTMKRSSRGLLLPFVSVEWEAPCCAVGRTAVGEREGEEEEKRK